MISNVRLTITRSALIATVLGGFLISPIAGAVDGAGGQALEIGPPLVSVSANPGESVTADISLRDITAGSLVVTNQINDFVANGETGMPKLILDDTATSPYSLKSWITPIAQMTLKAKEVKQLKITIRVPSDASPGGYYGVIRFTGIPPELKGTGVSLNASLGALVMLTVNGQAKEALSIEELSASSRGKGGSFFEAAPILFTERLKNSGNIHEEPSGIVTVTDMFGNVIATLGVNQPPVKILPDSIRKFESPLDSTNIGNKILFGKYQAELSITYGANKQVIKSTITFWVIPYTLIALAIAGMIAIFLLLRFAIRRYTSHIVRKVTGQQKPPKKPRASRR